MPSIVPTRRVWAVALACGGLTHARRLRREGTIRPHGHAGTRDDRADGGARNLDRLRGRQGIGMATERRERRLADEKRPRARDTHAPLRTRDLERVAPG